MKRRLTGQARGKDKTQEQKQKLINNYDKIFRTFLHKVV